jgi:small subunit ribosomal protein S16
MSVKIRLSRRGKKRAPIYDILVADSKAPRDGRFIEKLGSYTPTAYPAAVVLDEVKALKWLMVGAQPSETAKNILQKEGVMFRKHLQVGVNKGAITQEVADARYTSWKAEKEAKENATVKGVADKKVSILKDKLANEVKVNAARAEAIAKKNEVVEEVVAEAASEEVTDEVEAPAAEASEEAAAE